MGLIHLDAGVVIGFLDENDTHHRSARTVLAQAMERGDRLEMAASAFAECLVGPARRGEAAISTVRRLVERFPITIIPLDEQIAVSAAQLRAASRSLRLPDALVIATAIEFSADQLVTTDRKWPSASALGVGTRVTQI